MGAQISGKEIWSRNLSRGWRVTPVRYRQTATHARYGGIRRARRTVSTSGSPQKPNARNASASGPVRNNERAGRHGSNGHRRRWAWNGISNAMGGVQEAQQDGLGNRTRRTGAHNLRLEGTKRRGERGITSRSIAYRPWTTSNSYWRSSIDERRSGTLPEHAASHATADAQR